MIFLQNYSRLHKTRVKFQMWQPMYSRLFCYDIYWFNTGTQRALDLGAKFQIVAIRILRETEGSNEIRDTTFSSMTFMSFIWNKFVLMFIER